jgi:hypothetical protein
MPDTRDLRERAEAALANSRLVESTGIAPVWQEYEDAWHPGIALAALDVIAAAEAIREAHSVTEDEADALHDALAAALREAVAA